MTLSKSKIRQNVWNPFSRYADKQEKKIDRFLRWTSWYGPIKTKQRLLNFMQENLVILNLWLEFKFKGYKYLTKGKRKELYDSNVDIIEEFENFQKVVQVELPEFLIKRLEKKDQEKLFYLATIMSFLQPGKRYEYMAGASFGKILKMPMTGDCNQIVTYYVFLYSLKYSITDLEIVLPPEHIALRFQGIDIEATTGQFANYSNARVLPIFELISTNLLDVSDHRDKQLKIVPREFLKAAHLAEKISSNREIVEHNLQVAYLQVGLEALEAKDYITAFEFLQMTGDEDSLKNAMHNAVLKMVEDNDLDQAKRFAVKIKDQKLEKYILSREYNQIHAEVKNLKLISEMKPVKYKYEKMLDLAVKMGDDALAKNLRSIIDQL